MSNFCKISIKDMEILLEAGIAKEKDKDEFFQEEWNENHFFYERKWLTALVRNMEIAGCNFRSTVYQDCLPPDDGYVGFTKGKEELNVIFKEFGITPEFF